MAIESGFHVPITDDGAEEARAQGTLCLIVKAGVAMLE